MTKNPHDKDVEFIRALAELLNENGLTELQVKRDYGEDDSLNVRVSRMQTAAAVPAQQAPAPIAAAPAAAPVSAAATSPVAEGAEDPASHAGAVPSPMVGTAYLSAEPGADAFVKVGDKVEEGQTLLHRRGDEDHEPHPGTARAGTVKRILVEDGAAVEFGAATW